MLYNITVVVLQRAIQNTLQNSDTHFPWLSLQLATDDSPLDPSPRGESCLTQGAVRI